MKRYAIYRITTGEFRTKIVGYVTGDDGDIYSPTIPIREPEFFQSKRHAQDILNIMAQLPDDGWPRDSNGNIIKPTIPQRCKEEYEIVEFDDDAIVAYTQR